jgi:RNA-directed DNA polymerase
VLANLALDGLERQLHARYRHRDRSKPSTGVNLVRYADDFIVSARSREMLADIQRFIADEFLPERGLALSVEKTSLTHLDEGFDFLGQNVRRFNGKLIIQPSKKNRKAFLDKVRAVIKANPTVTAGQLIHKLNPLLRGWANYHRHVCSKKTYRFADYAIFRALWRWARRRHPNKNAHWVRRKYFRMHRQRSWTFSGETQGKDGKVKIVHLLYTTNTPIRRHIKIRGQANPFDPQTEMYFEKRLQTRMSAALNPKLERLWRAQQGQCPVCGQPITLESGWHTHHIVWHSLGGKDGLSWRGFNKSQPFSVRAWSINTRENASRWWPCGLSVSPPEI